MLHNDLVNLARNGLATEFERRLFDAALVSRDDVTNPLRFNNFAYAIRELTRHMLHGLAPDEKVLACAWYKPETDKPLGVSRRQRAVYSVQGGLDDCYVQDELGLDVHPIHKQLIAAIDHLSKYTHVGESTFGISTEDVDRMTHEVLNALCDFQKVVDECKHKVTQALEKHIRNQIVSHVLAETIMAIDELATHHSIDEVCTDHIEVERIDDQFIYIMARGTIACELQWGSSSDLRESNGAVLPQGFPFQCELKSDVGTPDNFYPDLTTLRVDTSSWWQ